MLRDEEDDGIEGESGVGDISGYRDLPCIHETSAPGSRIFARCGFEKLL